MKALYHRFSTQLSKLTDLPPLLFRLILAYGFLDPALKKLNGFSNIVAWFDSMGIPFPTVNAFLATAAESLGVVLLVLGLGTRIIAIPLMITMLVAIFAVHFSNGFAAGDNGYEIPLYYFLMLLSLLITGSGKWSVDHLLSRK